MIKKEAVDGEEEEPVEEQIDINAPYDELIEMRENEQDMRDITFKLRKEMNDLTMRMFLRTTILFKDIGIFEGKDKSMLY
jgi:hypothetical protein